MLPLVCNDAVAILFLFDLSRKSTLISIKEWFRQARGFNKVPSLKQSKNEKNILMHFTHSMSLDGQALPHWYQV